MNVGENLKRIRILKNLSLKDKVPSDAVTRLGCGGNVVV